MQQIIVEKAGGYEQLQVKDLPTPRPKAGEVLVRAKACGVNFADCCVRMGVYSSAKKYVGWPIVPGFEVAGEVLEIGEGVEAEAAGDRVLAVTRFGGYTSHLVVPQSHVLPLPEGMSFEEGAAFPSVFLTAYYGLLELAHPRKGETLLIHSAAGGVGSALVQLGKIVGCRVIGVVGSPHKVKAVRELGADEVIDKSTQDLWKVVEKLAPSGCDVVLDANGVSTLGDSYRHLSVGGRLVVYGFHSMLSKGRGKPNWMKVVWDYLRTPRFNPLDMTGDNKSVLAFNLSYLFDRMEFFRDCMMRVLTWYEKGSLRLPAIQSYPLEDAYRAHRDLEMGQTVGKLVLVPS